VAARRVSVQDLQHRQRPALLGQFAGHLVRRHEGHEVVKPVVVSSAKVTGVGQGARRHEGLQVRAPFQLVHQDGEQLFGGRILHQRHQRFAVAEQKTFGRFLGKRARNAQVGGQGRADAGDQHPFAHVREKVTAISA
jgi:hypothetical protein